MTRLALHSFFRRKDPRAEIFRPKPEATRSSSRLGQADLKVGLYTNTKKPRQSSQVATACITATALR